MNIHPSALLLAWLAVAVALPWFSVQVLWVASALLALGVWMGGVQACWRLIRRTRFLLLALILLYAFATPGTPLFVNWDIPTQEGLLHGGVQAWRLLLLVVALGLVLTSLSREKLLVGIYGLLFPFKPILPVDRIAVRLWLTMEYADKGQNEKSLHARWAAALTLPNTPATMITLVFPTFAWRDLGFMVGFSLLLVGALIW